MWLANSERVFDDIFSRFDTISACDRQTDRRTDGPTSCDSIVRAMHTHRAVKKFQFETKQRPLVKVVFTDIRHQTDERRTDNDGTMQ